MTACTITSLPFSSIPAASQPSTIGSRSSVMPTPLSDHRSWWLSEAALTVTVVQPSGGSGSGCSPSVRPASGSSGSIRVAVTANMSAPYLLRPSPQRIDRVSVQPADLDPARRPFGEAAGTGRGHQEVALARRGVLLILGHDRRHREGLVAGGGRRHHDQRAGGVTEPQLGAQRLSGVDLAGTDQPQR